MPTHTLSTILSSLYHTHTTGLALNAVHTNSQKLNQARQHTLLLEFSLFIYPTLSHDSLPSHTHNHSLFLTHLTDTSNPSANLSHKTHINTISFYVRTYRLSQRELGLVQLNQLCWKVGVVPIQTNCQIGSMPPNVS